MAKRGDVRAKSKRMVVTSIVDLAAVVHRRREELGYTIIQVGEMAGTSRFFVSHLEKAKPTCQFDKIMAVLGALGLKIELRAGAPKRPTGKPASSFKEFRRSLSAGPAMAIESAHDQPALIGCLECGLRVRSLQRHLSSAHAMRTTEYRRRWSLPDGYDLRPLDVAQAAESRRKTKAALSRVV